MELDQKKVVIGMSGGVDSSTTAMLLKKAGYTPIGVSLNLYSCDRPLKKGCCTPADRMDARRVCEQLEMPYAVIDLREDFRKTVIDYFAQEYVAGRTPLPCAPCNHDLRFQALLDFADKQGAYWIATGHYAQVKEGRLFRGIDPQKDQSYFLFGLPQHILARLMLPLGEYRKSEVRELASQFGLAVSDKKDSQELCFLGGEDHAHFISEEYPDLPIAAGEFIDEEGNVLGQHRGLPAYTIGQRRGLGLSFGERRYVTDLNAETNQIVIGTNERLFAKGLVATPVTGEFNSAEATPVEVKIRSTHPGTPALLTQKEDHVEVLFDTPQRAVMPGQAAVFYQNGEVLGGAWIEGVIHG